MKLFIKQFSQISLLFMFFGPNIVLSTLFSNTLSLCFSLNVRDQDLHPYRTTGKNYSSVYSDICAFRQQTRRQNVLD
jgi:hypothetical protein